MLNAAAMKDLLTANVDQNASHFAFFSRTGTIMGHDHAADVKAVKRFAAFAANTWAHNDNALRATGRTVAPLTPGTTVLQALVKPDGGGLHCLVVRVNGLVGAVTHVREGTLLAALKASAEFRAEGDELAGRIGAVERSGGSAASVGSASSEARGSSSGGEGEEGEARPSMMQILVWRSEGMGQYMADELGPGFRIPKGFH